jgi:hypothetical protein
MWWRLALVRGAVAYGGALGRTACVILCCRATEGDGRCLGGVVAHDGACGRHRLCQPGWLSVLSGRHWVRDIDGAYQEPHQEQQPLQGTYCLRRLVTSCTPRLAIACAHLRQRNKAANTCLVWAGQW